MSDTTRVPEEIQRVFEGSQRGVVGLVDDLLGLCPELGLKLDWHEGRCRIHSLGAEPYHAAEIPLGKTVFRAMLARIAALCNERTPNSVSPYGGKGEFSIWTEPPTVFHVAFTNTPDEQRIELIHVRDGKDRASVGDAAEDIRPKSWNNHLKFTS